MESLLPTPAVAHRDCFALFEGRNDRLLSILASVSEAIPLALARAKQASAPFPPGGVGDSPSGEPGSSGPEAGFWAVAPGCGDTSEGMVWVPRRSEAED